MESLPERDPGLESLVRRRAEIALGACNVDSTNDPAAALAGLPDKARKALVDSGDKPLTEKQRTVLIAHYRTIAPALEPAMTAPSFQASSTASQALLPSSV